MKVLRDIEQAVAFDDDRGGRVEHLIVEGFVKKDGDLYELTPSGEKALLENGAEVFEAPKNAVP